MFIPAKPGNKRHAVLDKTLAPEITPSKRHEMLAPWIDLANLAGQPTRMSPEKVLHPSQKRSEQFLVPLRDLISNTPNTEWFPADELRKRWLGATREFRNPLTGELLEFRRVGDECLSTLALQVLYCFRFMAAKHGSFGAVELNPPPPGAFAPFTDPTGILLTGNWLQGAVRLIDENGRLHADMFNPLEDYFLPALEKTEFRRIRICPICDRVFFAIRLDAGACSTACSHTLRQRKWREKTTGKPKHHRWSRRE